MTRCSLLNLWLSFCAVYGYELQGYDLNTGKFPLAKCLNGGAPRYYVGKKPGTQASNAGWVLYLKGGGSCKNEDECVRRAATAMGMPSKDATLDSSKVAMADDVEEMADYTRVYLPYCSGDSHVGNTSKGGLYMRGRPILDAVLDDLIDKHNLRMASVFVLTGTSAGGVGTFLNADFVKHKLDPLGIKTVAIPEGGMFYHSAFVNHLYTTLGLDVSMAEGQMNSQIEYQNLARNSACVNAKGWMAGLLRVPNKKFAIAKWGDLHEDYFRLLIKGKAPGISAERGKTIGIFHPACMQHAATPQGAMMNGHEKGDAISKWLQKLQYDWGLPGGINRRATLYQLISDVPGAAGQCSSTCCNSKCKQSVGCMTADGDAFFVVNWAVQAAHVSPVVLVLIFLMTQVL